MLGPERSKYWCRVEYTNIKNGNSYFAENHFCDAERSFNHELPESMWKNDFFEEGDRTKVIVTIFYQNLQGMEQILSMGMQEGFNMALTNLDGYLKEQHNYLK